MASAGDRLSPHWSWTEESALLTAPVSITPAPEQVQLT